MKIEPTVEKDEFQKTLEEFEKVATKLNSQFYMDGYDQKYPIEESGLWELIKEVEALPSKIQLKLFELEEINN